jgi:hypothetical protein
MRRPPGGPRKIKGFSDLSMDGSRDNAPHLHRSRVKPQTECHEEDHHSEPKSGGTHDIQAAGGVRKMRLFDYSLY